MYRLIICLTALTIAAPAQAALFSFTYEGTVQSSPSQGAVTVRGADWRSATGIALPDYAFETGDMLKIRFSGRVPSLENGVPDTDGLIRSEIQGATSVAGDPSRSLVDDVNIAGLNGDRKVSGLFGFNKLFITYDPANGDYGLEIENPDSVFAGTFNLPVYQLSEDEQTNRTARLFNNPDVNSQLGWSNARGSISELIFEGTDISFGSRNTLNGFTGPMRVAGGFGNLNVETDPVEVPAPPALLLFGAAAGVLAWRRRKAVI